MEPYRIREWIVPVGRLFTCGRPGRSKYKEAKTVPESEIHRWVRNLPEKDAVIISLLGRKQDGTSEFSFYPFTGGFESSIAKRPRLAEWLARSYPERKLEVREFPTVDYEPVPEATLRAAAAEVQKQLAAGRTVIIVDSGGQIRTEAVCRYMGFRNSK